MDGKYLYMGPSNDYSNRVNYHEFKIKHLQSSITSVTSNNCDGSIRSNTLNCLPYRGICSIKTGGTFLSFISEVKNDFSNSS